MESDLERMYRAGRIDMPAAAERLRKTVHHLHDRLQVLDTQTALAGDPQVMRSMLLVGGDVHEVLRKAVGTTYDAATAVVATADNFRETDEEARADYERVERSVREAPNPTAPPAPPSAGDPEAPGAPGTPTTPDPVDPEQDRAERDGTVPAPHGGR